MVASPGSTGRGAGGQDGTCLQPVKIYSNQASVDLYHNGVFFKKVDLPRRCAEVDVPFVNGKNTIELRVGNKTYDLAEIEFSLLSANPQEINVMLGSNRYFEDRVARIVWVPEKPYTPGSWGYIGGPACTSEDKVWNIAFLTIEYR